MTSREHRSGPAALIPWIIALVVLLGGQAIVPGHTLARKGNDPEGIALAPDSGDFRPAANPAAPVPWIPPAPSGHTTPPDLHGRLLGVVVISDSPAAASPRLPVQGRAPPVLTVA